MTHRRPKLVALVAAAALLLTAASRLPAPVGADRTPPSTPLFGYAQGFFCFTLYIGVGRVSDNVTPEPQLRYEAYANGEFIGLMDRGSSTSAWGNLKLRDEGSNQVFVEVVDEAGNRSRSETVTVTGYDCEV